MSKYLRTTEVIESNYSLQGVVIHSGTSEAGHYYSLIKIGENWYKFNDQTVTQFDLKQMPSEAFGGSEQADQWGDLKYSTNAYILFYRRVNKKKKEH